MQKKKKPLKACSVHGVVLEAFAQMLKSFLLCFRGCAAVRTAGEPEVGLCVCTTPHIGLLYCDSVKSGMGIIPSSTETQPVLGRTSQF